jgi:hypothetical protein
MIEVSTRLELIQLDSLYDAECPRCGSPLILHQPDVNTADVMLGICSDCQGWYLLDAIAGLMAKLPHLADLCQLALRDRRDQSELG